MIKIKLIFLWGIIFFLGYGSAFVFSKNEIKVNEIFMSDNSYGCSEKLTLLESKIEKLKDEGKSLAPVSNISKSKNYGESFSFVKTKNTSEQKELDYLVKYMMDNERKKHQDFLNSINATPNNINQALFDNFKKDNVDSTWAAEKKELLDKFINQDNTLRSLANVESECKSRQCRISILNDDPAALSQLSETVIKLTTENNEQFNSYTYVIDKNNHSTSIYLDRNVGMAN